MRGEPDQVDQTIDTYIHERRKPTPPLDFDLDFECEQAVARARRNIRFADYDDEPMDCPFTPHPSWLISEIVLMSALAFIIGFSVAYVL